MAFAAMAATNCSADLLCYEGFSPAGTNLDLASTATGTGFAGGWTNVTGAGGITRLGQVTGIPGYPANDYYAAPTGGCAQGNTSWNWACYVRPMSTPVDMTSGNTYYVSWLFNDESASMNCDLRLMLGDENARFFFGIGYGGGAGREDGHFRYATTLDQKHQLQSSRLSELAGKLPVLNCRADKPLQHQPKILPL